MKNCRAIFQLFTSLQVEKGPKISKIFDFGSDGCQKIVIWHPKNAVRVMKFFWAITYSPLMGFWPMVYTSLPYYSNVTSSKTIFGVIFVLFLIFDRNFWYLNCSDLNEILHGGSPWYQVPPVKIWSKLVNFKRGNDIIFLELYSIKTCFFPNLGTEKIFDIRIFFQKSFLGSILGAWKIAGPYFNFLLVYRFKKGLKSAKFLILGLTVVKKLLFDTQKMLSGSWNFLGASPTVP